MTTDAPRGQEEAFSRPATDEERAKVKLPTDAELREALAEGEKHRSTVEALTTGTAVAPRVLFR